MRLEHLHVLDARIRVLAFLEQRVCLRQQLGAIVALQLNRERCLLLADHERLADGDEVRRLDLDAPLARLDVLGRKLAVLFRRRKEAVTGLHEDERDLRVGNPLPRLVGDLPGHLRGAAPFSDLVFERIARAHAAAAALGENGCRQRTERQSRHAQPGHAHLDK
jgi:hypothetical protein